MFLVWGEMDNPTTYIVTVLTWCVPPQQVFCHLQMPFLSGTDQRAFTVLAKQGTWFGWLSHWETPQHMSKAYVQGMQFLQKMLNWSTGHLFSTCELSLKHTCVSLLRCPCPRITFHAWTKIIVMVSLGMSFETCECSQSTSHNCTVKSLKLFVLFYFIQWDMSESYAITISWLLWWLKLLWALDMSGV